MARECTCDMSTARSCQQSGALVFTGQFTQLNGYNELSRAELPVSTSIHDLLTSSSGNALNRRIYTCQRARYNLLTCSNIFKVIDAESMIHGTLKSCT